MDFYRCTVYLFQTPLAEPDVTGIAQTLFVPYINRVLLINYNKVLIKLFQNFFSHQVKKLRSAKSRPNVAIESLQLTLNSFETQCPGLGDKFIKELVRSLVYCNGKYDSTNDKLYVTCLEKLKDKSET